MPMLVHDGARATSGSAGAPKKIPATTNMYATSIAPIMATAGTSRRTAVNLMPRLSSRRASDEQDSVRNARTRRGQGRQQTGIMAS